MNNADRPAYPVITDDMPVQGDSGLTKREKAVLMMAQGLCANPALVDVAEHRIAEGAKAIADATLAAMEVEK